MSEQALATVRSTNPAVAATVELVNDRPAEALLRAADQYDALAIVVGTTGRGPIAGSLLGSVTYQVVHRSTRPVPWCRCLPATELPPAYDPAPWVRESARSCRSRSGIAISPVPIIAIILILFSDRARANGPAFLLGWVLGLAVVSTVVYLVSDAANAGHDSTHLRLDLVGQGPARGAPARPGPTQLRQAPGAG